MVETHLVYFMDNFEFMTQRQMLKGLLKCKCTSRCSPPVQESILVQEMKMDILYNLEI